MPFGMTMILDPMTVMVLGSIKIGRSARLMHSGPILNPEFLAHPN